MQAASQNFLLQCLSDFIANKKTEESLSELDWKDLFAIASKQSLSSIIYYQSNKIMPEDIKKEYLKQYLGSAVVSFKREEMTAEFIGALEQRGIPVIFIKGSVFREYYPLHPLRSMGDIDVVIHPEDRQAVDDILQKELGYECFVDNHSVWTYSKNKLYMEVHDHMFYEELTNKIDYRTYFDQVWTHISHEAQFGTTSDILYVPDKAFHFLYLITHTAKHIIDNGCGFRPYLDMVMMVQSVGDQMDWNWIASELEQLQLLKFAQISFACCERWFGAKMPLSPEAIDEDLFNTITEKTFKDGIFGLGNKDNEIASAAKDIGRSSADYNAAAVKRGVKRIFPPYQDMQLVPAYSFVDGRPWLLPAAWVYRLGYCAVRKMQKGKKYLLEPFTKKQEVLDRQELMKKWGLY